MSQGSNQLNLSSAGKQKPIISGYFLNDLPEEGILSELNHELFIRLTEAIERLESRVRSISEQWVTQPPPEKVGTPYISQRLGCTTVWVAEQARDGQIPGNCIVPGTGNGKPWKFYRGKVDAWISTR